MAYISTAIAGVMAMAVSPVNCAELKPAMAAATTAAK